MNASMRGGLAMLCIAATSLLQARPATAAPNPLRHDLALVNSHLRIAIEFAPEELGESMRAAEVICGLGRDAVLHEEPEAALADWSTLAQLVEEEAEGEARRVDTAFHNADSTLASLRERIEGRPSGAQPATSALHRGIAETRHGIAIMRVAIAGLAKPFADWRDHECSAAARGIEEAFLRAPVGLERINVGMLQLFRLVEPQPQPQPTERRAST